MRPELEPLPDTMMQLATHRGYPVPFFVEWVKKINGELVGQPRGVGEPDFRIMSGERYTACLEQRLCWVCGGELGAETEVFVIGPMCAVNRVSSEPPSHRICGEWSARNCPFLSRPHAVRRDINDGQFRDAPGVMVERNPGVAMVWGSNTWQTFRAHNNGGMLFDIGDPIDVTFWREGRAATREEIEHSIDTGLPLLEEQAEAESIQAVYALRRQVRDARKLIPA